MPKIRSICIWKYHTIHATHIHVTTFFLFTKEGWGCMYIPWSMKTMQLNTVTRAPTMWAMGLFLCKTIYKRLSYLIYKVYENQVNHEQIKSKTCSWLIYNLPHSSCVFIMHARTWKWNAGTSSYQHCKCGFHSQRLIIWGSCVSWHKLVGILCSLGSD